MSTRLSLALAAVLFLGVLAIGCGSESTPVLSGTSVVATTVKATTSTTEFPHPWSGNYGTVTDSDLTTPASSGPTTEFVPVAGAEEYAAKLTSWLQTPSPDLPSTAVPPSPEDEGYDPMSASQEEVEGWRQYAKLLRDHLGALEDIKPPAELSTAHENFIEGWKILCQYYDELAKAVEDKDDSALDSVRSTWWDAINHLIDADSAIQQAVGHGVLFD